MLVYVYRQGRYCRVIDLRIHVTDAAIALRNVGKKHWLCFILLNSVAELLFKKKNAAL